MSSNTDAGTIRDALLRRASMLSLVGALVAIGMSFVLAPAVQAARPPRLSFYAAARISGRSGAFGRVSRQAAVGSSLFGPGELANPACAGAAVADPCARVRSAVAPLVGGSGQIAGIVTDATTKAPIKGIEVCAFSTFFYSCATEPTNGNGEYTISGLITGEYVVGFFSPFSGDLNYVQQYYDDKSPSEEPNKVSVASPNEVSGINAALQEGGTIAGQVTDAVTKKGIEGIEVCASQQFLGNCATTNSNGEYKVLALSTGKYIVEFRSGLDYAPQYYNDKSISEEPTKVSVTAGEESSGINAAMHRGGHIEGMVTAAANHAAIEGIEVCAYRSGFFAERCATTTSSGEYKVTGLATGKYAVLFLAPYEEPPLDFAEQYFHGEFSFATANKVSVAEGGTTPGIDAEMHAGGHISGTVTAAASGSPIAEAEVCAYSEEEPFEERCAPTNPNGEYKVTALPTGQYAVVFFANHFETQFYNGKSEEARADLVSVTAGEEASGINATMHEPGEKPRSGGGNSSSSSSSGSSSPAAQGGTGVEASVATKSPQVTVGTIKSKSGAVYASLYCGAITGSCPAATVELTVVEQLHNGHVTAVTAGHGSRTTKRKVVVIGEVKVTLGVGQSKTVKVSLNSTGKKLLAQHKKLPVEALVLGEGATLKALKLKLTLPPKKRH